MSETAPPQVHPRRANAAEARGVAETLAAAFFDDPVIGWAMHDPIRRRRILPDFFELLALGSLEHDEAYTTDDLAAAALWLPPAALDTTEEDDVAFLAEVERVTHEFAPAVVQLFEILDTHHPHEPHHYLPVIGTRPEHQGRGIGSALLTTVLERCDREGMPAYLEATSERNQLLYARHGFRVTMTGHIPGGPPFWPMWREPQG